MTWYLVRGRGGVLIFSSSLASMLFGLAFYLHWSMRVEFSLGVVSVCHNIALGGLGKFLLFWHIVALMRR
jgi:hypothetical protein